MIVNNSKVLEFSEQIKGFFEQRKGLNEAIMMILQGKMKSVTMKRGFIVIRPSELLFQLQKIASNPEDIPLKTKRRRLSKERMS